MGTTCRTICNAKQQINILFKRKNIGTLHQYDFGYHNTINPTSIQNYWKNKAKGTPIGKENWIYNTCFPLIVKKNTEQVLSMFLNITATETYQCSSFAFSILLLQTFNMVSKRIITNLYHIDRRRREKKEKTKREKKN